MEVDSGWSNFPFREPSRFGIVAKQLLRSSSLRKYVSSKINRRLIHFAQLGSRCVDTTIEIFLETLFDNVIYIYIYTSSSLIIGFRKFSFEFFLKREINQREREREKGVAERWCRVTSYSTRVVLVILITSEKRDNPDFSNEKKKKNPVRLVTKARWKTRDRSMKYRYSERRDGDSTRLDSTRLDAFSSFREKENRIARVGRVPTEELPVPAAGAFSPGSKRIQRLLRGSANCL